MDEKTLIDRTRRWVSTIVIGLNLCPFARRVFEADAIRYAVTDATDEKTLLGSLTRELQALAGAPIAAVETTLLIHPLVFLCFLDYNDFLHLAEKRIDDLGLEGVIQIASFHPDYQFAGANADAVENYTNRSPYPMLHLLREDSISAVAGDADDLLAIPTRNIEMLRSLGKAKMVERLQAINK
jgi:hypothetical protein